MSDLGPLKQCEKINLSGDYTWMALPNMRVSRKSCNPCLFNGYVYLCGSDSVNIEMFSPHDDSFLLLPLLLPESSVSCLYVHNNSLVVHSYIYMTKFAAGKAGHLIQLSQTHLQAGGHKSSNSQPVVDQSRGLVFIIRDKKCSSFNIETGLQVRRFA